MQASLKVIKGEETCGWKYGQTTGYDLLISPPLCSVDRTGLLRKLKVVDARKVT
jgi:hypothetical protein